MDSQDGCAPPRSRLTEVYNLGSSGEDALAAGMRGV
jgi:hypothetical protein